MATVSDPITVVNECPSIVHTDAFFAVQPGATLNHHINNPLLKLVNIIESIQLAAEREYYLMETIQYLIPFQKLEFYGPNPPDMDTLDPTKQDNKTDFQKQNVKDFITTDSLLLRGAVTAGNWTGPFLRISYNGSPMSKLSRLANGNLGEAILCYIEVNGKNTSHLLTVPYNTVSERYELEIWGYPDDDLYEQLDIKGRLAIDRGELITCKDLIQGNLSDFDRNGKDGLYIGHVARNNSMHPINPLHIELAWTNQNTTVWDSMDGNNYHYEFNMKIRGWDSYLGVGTSINTHAGIGLLEYRNLFSNYFYPYHSKELGRCLQPWNFNAAGKKNHDCSSEDFMAVDYIDLHIMKPNSGIGLHRHRDNQEVFFLLYGQNLVVIGDWLKMPQRERCFEIRTLRAGHLALLKGGNIHGLLNVRDEDSGIFMFGGYD